MKTKKFFFYILAGLFAGCVPVVSLHPLFTKENVVFEEKVIGTWVDDVNNPKTTWEFAPCDKKGEQYAKAYKLTFKGEDGKKGLFLVRLVKLENRLFLDVYPYEVPWEPADPNKLEWACNVWFLMPVHTFVRIDSIEPVLKMRLTDDDKMNELFSAQPKAVAHEVVEQRLLLTASTKELQAFVLKYADDERVFPTEIVLKRKK